MDKESLRKELSCFLEKQSDPEITETWESIKPHILITADELSSKAQGNPGVLLAYADSCGHCTRFKPEFVKLYTIIQKCNTQQENWENDPKLRKTQKKEVVYRKFNIFAMDAADERNARFLSNQNMRGVPTIFFITASGSISTYDKSRDAFKIWTDLQNLNTVKKVYY